MKIIQDLLNSIVEDHPINRLQVGVHWTAISSKHCGMASTVTSTKPHGEDLVQDAGILERKSAHELANYLNSENPLEASIGLASLNSLVEIPKGTLKKINAFKYLVEKSGRKHVAIFGHFPYLDEIRQIARKLTVFELNPGENEHSVLEIPELLPGAEIVAITSNSIINHTLDLILPHLNKGAFVAMVGPSTPLSPILFDHGISMLAGVQIINEDALYHSISQGAIFRQMKGAELVTWIK